MYLLQSRESLGISEQNPQLYAQCYQKKMAKLFKPEDYYHTTHLYAKGILKSNLFFYS